MLETYAGNLLYREFMHWCDLEGTSDANDPYTHRRAYTREESNKSLRMRYAMFICKNQVAL